MIEYLVIKYEDGIDRTREIQQLLKSSRDVIHYKGFPKELKMRFGLQPSILLRISEPRQVREMMNQGFLAYDVIDGIVQSQCSVRQRTIQ